MKFSYWVTLDVGYKPVMSTEECHDVQFTIEAPNRATADRMVKAMLDYSSNVTEYDGVCVEE